MLRRERRNTIFFTAVAFGSALLISGAVFQQYYAGRRPPERPPVEGRVTPLSRNYTLPEKELFLIDELPEPTGAPRLEGSAALTIASLKDSAYFLVQADKAVRENRLEDALGFYRKALGVFPALQGAHRAMGVIFLQQKDYTNAVACFEHSNRAEPETHGVANNHGVAWMAMTNASLAEQAFQRALKLNPAYPTACFNLATLYQRRGDMAQASDYFQKYLALKPDDMATAQTYAKVLIDLKQWALAALWLKKIAEVSPEAAPVHFRLAQALANNKKLDEGIKALERGVSLVDSRLALSWMSRPDFDALRDHPRFKQLLDELGTDKL